MEVKREPGKTVGSVVLDIENDLIRLIQHTSDHDLLDHLVKALAEVRKASCCLE